MLMEHAEWADEAMDVIAAGGGPVGLMTAALLDVAGVRVGACDAAVSPPGSPGARLCTRAPSRCSP